MARTFTPTGDSIISNSDPVGSYPFFMVSWVRPRVNQVIWGISLWLGDKDVDNVMYHLGLYDDPVVNHTNVFARNTTGVNAFGTTTIPNVEWSMISAFYRSATDRESYYGATSESTSSTSVTYSGNVDRVAIGAIMRSSATGYFDGAISHCAIYTTEPTANVLTSLNNGVNPFAFHNFGLAFYCPVEGSGTTESDYGGQLSLTVASTAKTNDNPAVELLENYL